MRIYKKIIELYKKHHLTIVNKETKYVFYFSICYNEEEISNLIISKVKEVGERYINNSLEICLSDFISCEKYITISKRREQIENILKIIEQDEAL